MSLAVQGLDFEQYPWPCSLQPWPGSLSSQQALLAWTVSLLSLLSSQCHRHRNTETLWGCVKCKYHRSTQKMVQRRRAAPPASTSLQPTVRVHAVAGFVVGLGCLGWKLRLPHHHFLPGSERLAGCMSSHTSPSHPPGQAPKELGRLLPRSRHPLLPAS